jgi:hypothetical protein
MAHEHRRIEACFVLRRAGIGVQHEVIMASASLRTRRTWYVTFEVPRSSTVIKRRNPRLTETFETEAEGRDFARTKFEGGLIVTAGTIIPHLPRRAIPSVEIPAWLEAGQAL